MYLLRDADHRCPHASFFISNKSFRKDHGSYHSKGNILYTRPGSEGEIFIYYWLGHFIHCSAEQTGPLTFIVIMGASIEEVYRKGISMEPGGVFEGKLEK